MPQLPDGWLDYGKMGEIVEDSRFLPIKVPLSEQYDHFLPKESRFSAQHVVDLVQKKNMKIGLVIDLTYTRKYYNPIEFTKFGIKYKKIFVPGKQIPPSKVCKEFNATVIDFESTNKHNDDVIVVHCTHGLNRTGYMVCRYLIEEKSVLPKNAISMFNKARQHDMERQNYLQDLLARYSSELASNESRFQSPSDGNLYSQKTVNYYSSVENQRQSQPFSISSSCFKQPYQYHSYPQRTNVSVDWNCHYYNGVGGRHSYSQNSISRLELWRQNSLNYNNVGGCDSHQNSTKSQQRYYQSTYQSHNSARSYQNCQDCLGNNRWDIRRRNTSYQSRSGQNHSRYQPY